MRWKRVVAASALASAVVFAGCGGSIVSNPPGPDAAAHDSAAHDTPHEARAIDASVDVAVHDATLEEDAGRDAPREALASDARHETGDDATSDGAPDARHDAPSITALTVTPPNPFLNLNCGPVQLVATASYSDGSTTNVTTESAWTSASPDVASVDANTGIATPVGFGDTVISAAFQSFMGSVDATVGGGTIVSVTLSPPSATLAVGGTQPFAATANLSDGSMCDVTGIASWQSSATGVAAVSFGVTTAIASGGATITASEEAVSGTATLTVN